MKAFKISIFTILFSSLILSCDFNRPYRLSEGYIMIQNESRHQNKKEWELVWEESFEAGQLDEKYWSKLDLHSTEGLGQIEKLKEDKNAWKRIINSWSSYMSSKNTKTVTFEEGKVYLKALLNPDTTAFDNRPYHTGGIWTKKKFAFQYGRLEIKAKLEPAYGAWPALWLIPEKKIYKDQHNGEMDIIERLNHDPFVYQTLHSHWNLNLKLEKPQRFTTAEFKTDDFNIFWLEWTPTAIRFGVNEKQSLEYKKIPGGGTFQWPFDQPFFLILSQQLEGWPGKVTNPEELPIDMVIDWARLYQ